MFHSIILVVSLIAIKGFVRPSPESIPLSNMGDTPPTAKDFYISSRRILPMAAFGGASHIAMLGLFLHLFNLLDTPGGLGQSVLYICAGLYTGLFAGMSVRCAENLVKACGGPPDDAIFRKRLMRELSVFPLLPLIVASVI